MVEDDPQEALSFLSAMGRIKDLTVLIGINTAAAGEAKLCILARHQPESVLEEFASSRVPLPVRVIEKLKIAAPEFSEELLIKSLLSPNTSIRLLAFMELKRRGRLSRTQVITLLEDTSAHIKRHAIEWLISEGEYIEPEKIRELIPKQKPALLWPWRPEENLQIDLDKLVNASLSILPKEKLEEMVYWASIEGYVAYGVLAERYFDTVGDMIREDLRTGFSRIRESWLTQMQSYGPAA